LADAVSDTVPMAAIDRSERRGHVWLVLALAGVLVGALLALLVVANDQATPLIYALMSVFSMAGVFFLFAYAIGALQFAGAGARDDLTKLMADTAAEGCLAVEDDGRVIYANESYLLLAGADSSANVRPVERLFTGAPEVSEAIYRLAQAAREHRAASEEIRLSPAPASSGRDFGWYRVRVRPLPRPGGKLAALWTVADVTHERERQENVFQELQHAIDYLDHAPAGFLSIDPAAPSST
jgi:two-component system cell cycle sensor histidine kinase/response regulator CckA